MDSVLYGNFGCQGQHTINLLAQLKHVQEEIKSMDEMLWRLYYIANEVQNSKAPFVTFFLASSAWKRVQNYLHNTLEISDMRKDYCVHT